MHRGCLGSARGGAISPRWLRLEQGKLQVHGRLSTDCSQTVGRHGDGLHHIFPLEFSTFFSSDDFMKNASFRIFSRQTHAFTRAGLELLI